jgi:hypothetical protein
VEGGASTLWRVDFSPSDTVLCDVSSRPSGGVAATSFCQRGGAAHPRAYMTLEGGVEEEVPYASWGRGACPGGGDRCTLALALKGGSRNRLRCEKKGLGDLLCGSEEQRKESLLRCFGR